MRGLLVGEVIEADEADDAGGADLGLGFLALGAGGGEHDFGEGALVGVVQADHDVLDEGQLAEELDVLEGAADAGGGDLGGFLADEADAFQLDVAAGGHVDAGEHVHHGAFAGAVGADQAVDGARHDGEIDVVQRLEAAELHQDALHLEQGAAGFDLRLGRGPDVAVVALGGDDGVGLDHAGAEAGEGGADEAVDAVGQVIDDEEDHGAEDGELEVGDLLQRHGEGEEGDAEDDRDHEPGLVLGAAVGDGAGDDGDEGDHPGDDAEQLDIGQQVGQDDDDDGAEDGADAGLAAAEGDGEEELDGQLDAEVVGGDVLLGIGEERAGEARHARAEGEGDDLVLVDADAHAVGRDGAVAQGLEGAAVAAGDEAVDGDEAEKEADEDEEVELELLEPGRRHVEEGDGVGVVAQVPEDGFLQGDAEGTVGEEVHLVDEGVDDGAEGEGDHRQVGSGDLQRGEREHHAEQGGDDDAGGDGGEDADAELEAHDPGGVCADAEQGGVAQRDLAGVAEDDVEPEQEDGEDEDDDQQMQVVGVRHHEGEEQQDNDQQAGFEECLHWPRPS